jgi:hypothetical protein
MEWKASSIEDVRRIVQDDLANCDPRQTAVFEKYRVGPHYAPIARLGGVDHVVVVAKKENQVIYWEDIEEGFGVSQVDTDGKITEQDCNQNDLSLAINAWIQPSTNSGS